MPNPRVCAIQNCDKMTGVPGTGRGFCSAHYTRWKRHGDPLGGGTSPGDPLKFIQEMVLPYDGDACIAWPYATGRNGEAKIRIDGQLQLVSRFVCEKTKGPPPTPRHEAAHECGKGHMSCITPHHLNWKTPKENNADKIRHGTLLFGDRCPWTKLSDEQVREIRALHGVTSQSKIAARFNVNPSTICDILRGKKRNHS